MTNSSTTIPTTGRVLALDWGHARIGVAITDETQLLASPLGTLTRRAGKRLPLGQFLDLIEREHPVGLVVGLPLDDEGTEGESAQAARAMGEQFAARAALPIAWIDESFTTAETLERLTERGIAPRQRKADIDAMAAAIVLERWLDTRRK
ncbi:MAG: Holliday junction resolvase RuvX [Gemmatimonadales bacterium]|nr:Holliday junction resolvase RuvX [Gemmatimonadales bacterium]MBP6571201.1 Holliday junction resolvase RuvX [Gemmatimonadales bacterium]MBP7620091.1 Holliday junction resolvase RuvX [Gemmatimonadales bacterium]